MRLARALLLMSWAVPAAAQAQPDAPPFQLTRYDEDYAPLADPDRRIGAYERVKYIPLAQDAFLSLGGEFRLRVDTLHAARFGIGAPSDDYALERMLLHADLHLGSHLRAFVQGIHADVIGKRPVSAIDVDRADLENAFVDVMPVNGLTLRAGRQELTFNPTQRFVAVREGPNVRQAFDGFRAGWVGSRVRIDAFALRPVVDRAGDFDDSRDRTQLFYGGYGSAKITSSLALDLYLVDFR